MNIQLTVSQPALHSCATLVIGCCEDEWAVLPWLKDLNQLLGGIFDTLYESREFTGKLNKTKVIHTFGKIPAERLLLVGLGKREEIAEERLRQAGGSAILAARPIGLVELASTLHLISPDAAGFQAVIEGMFLGNYSFTRYQRKGDQEKPVDSVTFVFPENDQVQEAEHALNRARIVCEAAMFARDLVSQPANVATPTYLAEEALELADPRGLAYRVIEREEMESLGMDALLAVAKGSVQPPKFVILEYLPMPNEPPVVLVGKGVTFDSGGISLKPREGMEKMKTDMAGAAAVMATIRAVADLRLQVNVVGLLPAVENLPGGSAYKPGDVITSLSGQTIEIVNTDAEGRMILCDGLHYAQQYNPAAIIDVATLTGACVVALGACATGLMGTDEKLTAALKAAGEKTGERVWELPLWDDYADLMKSDIADMKNAGGPNAGAISAAWFLRQFVREVPWAHLDIAGTAWEEKGRPYAPKGATGVGVRLLVELLEGLATGE